MNLVNKIAIDMMTEEHEHRLLFGAYHQPKQIMVLKNSQDKYLSINVVKGTHGLVDDIHDAFMFNTNNIIPLILHYNLGKEINDFEVVKGYGRFNWKPNYIH